MKLLIHEIQSTSEPEEIELPEVPRAGDYYELPDGKTAQFASIIWKSGALPVAVYRRLECS